MGEHGWLPVDDVCLTNHLIEPVFDGGVLLPPRLGRPVGDGVNGDLVAQVGQLVNHGVVGVLVRHVESPVDRAAVGVLPRGGKQPLDVQVPVLSVHRVCKCVLLLVL